jgi:hypothetical protein
MSFTKQKRDAELRRTLQLHHNGALQYVNKRMCIVSVPNGETVLLTRLCETRNRVAVASFSAPCEGSRGAKARFIQGVLVAPARVQNDRIGGNTRD